MRAPHRSFIITGIVIVVIILGTIFALYRKHLYFQSPIVFLPNPQHFINNDKAYPVQQSDATQSVAQSYGNTVMQFDKHCVASPATISAQVGDTIMFDNRSDYHRSITVGAQHYDVEAFGHVILSFGTRDTYPVSCDSFLNVGIIGIQ